jgi:hypothetical protein
MCANEVCADMYLRLFSGCGYLDLCKARTIVPMMYMQDIIHVLFHLEYRLDHDSEYRQGLQ